MDDFALLVSPTVLLSAFVSLSVTRALILPRFFPFFCTNPTRETQEDETGGRKKKKGRNWSLENVASFFFHATV